MRAKLHKPTLSLHRLRLLFLAVALVVVVGGLASYFSGLRAHQARESVQHYNNNLEQLQDTLSTIQNIETSQRGYLLTLNAQYLEPYTASLAEVRRHLQGLASMAESGHLPAPEVTSLSGLINKKLTELARTVELMRAGQRDAALQIVREGSGRTTMDDIRAAITGLKIQQQQMRSQAEKMEKSAVLTRGLTFIIVMLANLFFLAWTYVRIRHSMTQQYVAALETQRQKDILSVTLASIGDGVIITDTRGRITFLNEVAEHLTGWTAAEALDQSCSRVFNIINEQSRSPVDSPIDKVLKAGVIGALTDQTLLIRKDGSEVPIDDCGAPIRETDGTVRGVVLVFRDFTAHKENQNILTRAKDEMESANRAKDRFLTTLSHELRTPLTPVLALLSSWEKTLPAPFQPDLHLIRRNVELETRLIDDLLDLTRIDHGKLTLEKQTLDAHDILETVASLFRPDCGKKNIQLTLSLQARHSLVEVDPGRLQQIFWNIISNAVKFTPPGGRIKLETVNPPAEKQLKITITDTGIGMAKETLGRLFQRFEQGDLPAEWKSRGLGLGLSIAKALTDAHGGQLHASSGGPDSGSSFEICLPFIDSQSPPRDGKFSRTGAAAPQKLRVLLLEDHADTGVVLQTMLHGIGHTVDLCSTVKSAVEKIRSLSYDVLLSDLSLPDGSGLDFIRAAREICSTPAIALTGYGSKEDIDQCLQAGFTEHLTKPVDFDSLCKVLHLVGTSAPIRP